MNTPKPAPEIKNSELFPENIWERGTTILLLRLLAEIEGLRYDLRKARDLIHSIFFHVIRQGEVGDHSVLDDILAISKELKQEGLLQEIGVLTQEELDQLKAHLEQRLQVLNGETQSPN